MKVLSLFSGIAGLCEEGIKIANLDHRFKVKQFVECSGYATKHLRKTYPLIDVHDNIKTFTGEANEFDIVCGGVPCQGSSNAGDRQGLADSRTGLWSEMFRIISKVQPKFVLLENPPGLAARGLITILRQLDSIRYLGEWTTISAQEVGLPHLIKRIFLIANPYGLQFKEQPTSWADQVRASVKEVRESEQVRVYQPGATQVGDGVSVEVAKGLPGNFEARRAYGLSCSPRQSAIAWKRIDYLRTLIKE